MSTGQGTGVYPGTVAIAPTGNGGTVGSDRDGGVTLNPGKDSGKGPCKLILSWIAARLSLAKEFVIAQDSSLRNLAVISLEPFAVVQEYRFPSAGLRIASDVRSSKMLAFNLGASIGLL